jgi:hypothetical protein
MKLNAKQEEIKAKILAGTHVLKNDVNAEKAVEVLNNIKYSDKWSGTNTYYGVTKDFFFAPIICSQIKGRPIINMSEWFEESEETSESTKDFQGSREYDEKLIVDFILDICNGYRKLNESKKAIPQPTLSKRSLTKGKS